MTSAAAFSDELDESTETIDVIGGEKQTAVPDENSEQESQQRSGCPNCGTQSYTASTWCKKCGYYSLLGRCVELEEWERESEPGECVEEVKKSVPVWRGIPGWAWLLGAVLAGVCGVSFAGRHVTEADSAPRVTWAICQVVIGMAAFIVAHIRIAKSALAQDANLGLGDAIANPLRVWIGACLDFEHLSRWMAMGIGGIWSVILAHALLGVPYGALFTHEEPPLKGEQPPAAAAAPKPAGASAKQMSMEEAMNEVSKKSGAKAMADKANGGKARVVPKGKEEDKQKPEIKQLDCLIVGYSPGAEGNSSVRSLVVAVRSGGEWSVIGTVSNGLTPQIQRELSASAKSLHRQRPFVESNYSAIWLEPVLRCHVEAEYAPGQNTPTKLRFVGLK